MTAAQELTVSLRRLMPFAELLDIEAITAGPTEVRARVRWRPELSTSGGVLHGGTLMALADSVGAWCASFHLPPGASTTTAQSATNLLRAVRDRHVEAVAQPLHTERTIIVIETELRDADTRLVAKTTQTQAVLKPSP